MRRLSRTGKRPTDYHRGEIIGTYGSFNTFQGAFDLSGPLDKSAAETAALERTLR